MQGRLRCPSAERFPLLQRIPICGKDLYIFFHGDNDGGHKLDFSQVIAIWNMSYSNSDYRKRCLNLIMKCQPIVAWDCFFLQSGQAICSGDWPRIQFKKKQLRSLNSKGRRKASRYVTSPPARNRVNPHTWGTTERTTLSQYPKLRKKLHSRHHQTLQSITWKHIYQTYGHNQIHGRLTKR